MSTYGFPGGLIAGGPIAPPAGVNATTQILPFTAVAGTNAYSFYTQSSFNTGSQTPPGWCSMSFTNPSNGFGGLLLKRGIMGNASQYPPGGSDFLMNVCYNENSTILCIPGGANGNVGIGTTNPLRALSVASAQTLGPFVVDQTTTFTDTVILVRASQAAATTFNYAQFQSASGGVNNCIIRGDGNIANTNNSYGAISDRNLKENIVDARSYQDDLNKLRVVRFSFKAENSSAPTQIGLIAQEVAEIFPSLVDEDKDGTKNLKYSILNIMMLKMVQELSAKNADLESRLETAQNDIDLLESRLAALESLVQTNIPSGTLDPSVSRSAALLAQTQ